MIEKTDTDLLAEISKFLHYHKSLGITVYPRTTMLEHFLEEWDTKKPSPPQTESLTRQKIGKYSKTSEQKHSFDPGLSAKTTLQDVREEIGDCKRCPLRKTRTNIVFGEGPADAKLMIVADAPAEDDDRQCLPFQGPAGDLLDKMLAAINLSRQEVYLTTLVKCYPGAQARPREDEIKTCFPFLLRQIEIICPTVICTMGMLTAQKMLHSQNSLFQLRGRFYNFNDLCSTDLDGKIVVMPSLPPSLLLENADLKKASWKDLQMVQKRLEEG